PGEDGSASARHCRTGFCLAGARHTTLLEWSPGMIDVAAIGAGWVTGERHIPSLLRSKRCRGGGVIAKALDRPQKLADRYPLPHAADSLDAPWLENVAACTVGVSPRGHFEVVGRLLERGKHVLMEKPMCLTVPDGETLVRLAGDRKLVLGLVHNFQFARSAVKARKQLASGRWGKVTAIHGFQLSSPARRLPTWYEDLPLGLFY